MKETSSIVSTSTQGALASLFNAIRKKYPAVTDSQAEHLQNKVMTYVADGIADGYDLALIKRQDNKSILKVLKLMEEDDR